MRLSHLYTQIPLRKRQVSQTKTVTATFYYTENNFFLPWGPLKFLSTLKIWLQRECEI